MTSELPVLIAGAGPTGLTLCASTIEADRSPWTIATTREPCERATERRTPSAAVHDCTMFSVARTSLLAFGADIPRGLGPGVCA
ncbi:hypothetical protein [Nocardia thraciensis]